MLARSRKELAALADERQAKRFDRTRSIAVPLVRRPIICARENDTNSCRQALIKATRSLYMACEARANCSPGALDRAMREGCVLSAAPLARAVSARTGLVQTAAAESSALSQSVSALASKHMLRTTTTPSRTEHGASCPRPGIDPGASERPWGVAGRALGPPQPARSQQNKGSQANKIIWTSTHEIFASSCYRKKERNKDR